VMVVIKHGVTRTVFVFNKFVVKIPTMRFDHEAFLDGMCGNWRERTIWKDAPRASRQFLADVYFCLPFGLLLIMKKAKRWDDVENLKIARFFESCDFISGADVSAGGNCGTIEGRLVLFDYGNYGFMIHDPDMCISK
jgi:hypothetical protein